MASKWWDWGHNPDDEKKKTKKEKKEDKKKAKKEESGKTGSAYKGFTPNYIDDEYGDFYGGYRQRSFGHDDYSGGHRSYSNWNWGTWGGSTSLEDDDDGVYMKSHQSYFTPSKQEISWKLDYHDDTENNRNTIREYCRYFYHRMIDEKDYFKEKYSHPETLGDEEIATYEMKKVQYTDLWDKFIPGYTPLEQAMSLFNEMKRTCEKAGKKMDKMTQEELTMKSQALEFHEEIYKDPIFNELLEMHDISKTHKIEILNMIAMIEDLGSQFKIEKEITEKIAHNSRLISKKIMRDYSQLHMVDLYQRLMPTFNTKLLTKDLIINTPIERTEHKQKIIIMVDYSGSMRQVDKQKWVLAIMIDRLKYVIKEEAEVFFSFFVNRPQDLKFHHLFDRKSALEFWAQFSTMPNGGDTDIGSMIDKVKDEIEVRKQLCNLKVDLSTDKPEVLIINDGQDSIKTKSFRYKTNAITIVDSENQELKQLCLDNDGKYVYARNDGVTTYDKGGKLVKH